MQIRNCARRTLIAAATILSAVSSLHADVIHVRASASAPGDGLNWQTAYPDLQQALAAASAGDEIWVAAGTYTPAAPGDSVTSFVMLDAVGLYGGFAGTETLRTQRNPAVHVTILSGDVGHDDSYVGGAANWNFNTSNSGHVVVGSGVGAGAVLDGFTVMAGSIGPVGTGAGDPLMYGSGLYVFGGSPTVRDCLFTRNRAAFASGAGIYCYNSAPIIQCCRFVENFVHLGNGGGIAAYGNALPVISDCTFQNNEVTASSGNTGQGAGICFNFLTASLSAAIERCEFDGNIARTFYTTGGNEIGRGGGISNFGAMLTVRDCVFHHNSANAGAGLQTWDPATVINCLFYANDVYAHEYTTVASDGGYGAGICIYSFQTDVATIINSTIAHNSGGEGVGVQSLANSSVAVRNSIIWGNIASGEDVSPINAQIRGSSSIRHSCVEDLLTPIPDEDPPEPANYPGCIVVDPQFRNVSGSDFRLAATSPCIDAGRNSYVPAGVLLDLDGDSRRIDDPSVADTGTGSAPLVDMGAYEFSSLPIVGDINCDGQLNSLDAQTLAQVLVGADTDACHLSQADVSGDALVDGDDVSEFVAVLLGA